MRIEIADDDRKLLAGWQGILSRTPDNEALTVRPAPLATLVDLVARLIAEHDGEDDVVCVGQVTVIDDGHTRRAVSDVSEVPPGRWSNLMVPADAVFELVRVTADPGAVADLWRFATGRWEATRDGAGHYLLDQDGSPVGDLHILPRVGHLAMRADSVRQAMDRVDRLVARG